MFSQKYTVCRKAKEFLDGAMTTPNIDVLAANPHLNGQDPNLQHVQDMRLKLHLMQARPANLTTVRTNLQRMLSMGVLHRTISSTAPLAMNCCYFSAIRDISWSI